MPFSARHRPDVLRRFRRVGLAVACALGVSGATAQVAEPSFKHLSDFQTLPDLTVQCFAQDRHGFVWMGTGNGLCRFDGRTLKTFFADRADSTSLPSSNVPTLFADRRGTLWVGTAGRLCRFDETRQRFARFATPGGRAVRRVAEDRQGNLWVGTNQGLLFFRTATARFEPLPLRDSLVRQALTDCYVSDLQTDDRGVLYAATNQGVKILDPASQRFREFRHDPTNPSGIGSDDVVFLAPDRAGHVWLAINEFFSTVERLDPATGTVARLPLKARAFGPRKEGAIRRVLVDRRGRVWFVVREVGLMEYDPATDQTRGYPSDRSVENGLVSPSIVDLFEDRDGGIWLGTEGYGADWFYPDEQHFFNFRTRRDGRDGLPHDWGRAALEDRQGNWWLGTGQGVVVYKPGQGFVRRYAMDAPPAPGWGDLYSVRSLLEDRQGAVWVGLSTGINRIDPSGRLRAYTWRDSLRGPFCWALLLTRQNELLLGSRGGLQRYNPQTDRFDAFDHDPLYGRFARANVRSLLEDRDGGLWVGFFGKGLVYWHRRRGILRHYRTEVGNLASLPDDVVVSLAEDRDGFLWAATHDGLTRFDRRTGRFRTWGRAEGFPSSRFAAVLVDDENRVWAGTSTGLCCLDRDRRTVRRFTTDDGLATDDFNDQAACRFRDGRFCYPTMRGFSVFRPSTLLARPVRPSPRSYLTRFLLFNQPHDLANPESLREATLRPNQNFFTFEWAAPAYRRPGKYRYAHQLVGLDPDWVTTDNPVATYANVPGGDYAFRFRVLSPSDGWVGTAGEVRIHVGTVFYRQPWFIALAVLALGGLAYAVYRFRLRQAVRISELQMASAKLEKDNAQVQHQNLINQLNPHFLFNSLTSLSSLIRVHPEQAADFVERLSRMYRHILQSKDRELVPLEQELKFLQNYADLQRVRFGEGLQFDVADLNGALHRQIAPVTLQNLVENAIKHNVTDEERPLRIRVYAADGYLVVENNLQKKTFVETSNRQGLVQLQSLYRHLSPDRPLEIREEGARFTVKIPLL